MPYQGDKEIEKLYYKIGEIAAMFNMGTQAVRFWLTEFGIEPKRSKRGFRLFVNEDIETLKKIHHLVKVRRFTIAGAKLELREMKL